MAFSYPISNNERWLVMEHLKASVTRIVDILEQYCDISSTRCLQPIKLQLQGLRLNSSQAHQTWRDSINVLSRTENVINRVQIQKRRQFHP